MSKCLSSALICSLLYCVSNSSVDAFNSLKQKDAFSRVVNQYARDMASTDKVKLSSSYLDEISTTNNKESSSPSSSPSSSLKISFFSAASPTDRGQSASPHEKSKILSFISELEEINTAKETASGLISQGTWELVYSSTQLFRSSPFFMAGRAVCKDGEQAKQYDWFCDMHREALAISRIGKVRQIVSDTRLVSEFEVKVGAVPFLSDFTPLAYSGGLPLTVTGSIVSSADIIPIDSGSAWEIFMDCVEIKGSNIPLLRACLDAGIRLQSRKLGSFLEENVDSYKNPKPIFRTTYIDNEFRISRDQDDQVFVYVKTSQDTMPTDYAEVKADLGIADLWNGFSSSVLNF